jgi:hypothetical protein
MLSMTCTTMFQCVATLLESRRQLAIAAVV